MSVKVRGDRDWQALSLSRSKNFQPKAWSELIGFEQKKKTLFQIVMYLLPQKSMADFSGSSFNTNYVGFNLVLFLDSLAPFLIGILVEHCFFGHFPKMLMYTLFNS